MAIEISDGVTLHLIKDNKFKTNFISFSFITKLKRENITKNVLLPLVLRRGNVNLPTMKEMSKKLDDMYGASLDAKSEKKGDNISLSINIETISNEYALEDIDLLQEAINLIKDFVFNPILENGHFKDEFVNQEKETLKELINSKINDKAQYSVDRAIEEMFNKEPYGIYKYGYVEDLDSINSTNLYEQYLELINTSKVEIFVNGTFDEENVKKQITEIFSNINREYNEQNYIKITERNVINKELNKEINIIENQDVIQGKFVLGYRCKNIDLIKDNYKMSLYSAILGGTASSKLFLNVREKLSLAYTIRSLYITSKGAVLISAGIENQNFEVCREATLKEIENIKIGNVTNEELEAAKANYITSLKSINDSQQAMCTFILNQELFGLETDLSLIIEKINQVSLEEIIEIANKLEIQLSYFLTK